MNETLARTRVSDELVSLRHLIAETQEDSVDRHRFEDEQGDATDRLEPLVSEQSTDAILASLHARLHALERAEKRLDDGTYGRSLRSGAVISDERLEADPAAELTVDEARDDSPNAANERADEI